MPPKNGPGILNNVFIQTLKLNRDQNNQTNLTKNLSAKNPMNHTPPEICLAPLRGFTDAVFRNTYTRYFQGIDRAVSPFLATTQGDKIKTTHFRDVLPENNTGLPLVPQVLGNSARAFVVLAERLLSLGYDHINLNLGCPYPKVARKKRGSGLLPHPDLLAGFLSEVMDHLPPDSLSIKMRLGYFHGDEIFCVLPILNQYRLRELIIHPRTGTQMYAGDPDLDRFEQCLGLVRHPVVYNGDIRTMEDFKRLKKRFPGVQSWMIGRGVFRDPFLPARIKDLAWDRIDAIERLKAFHDNLFSAYAERLSGASHVIGRMKGFWTYFAGAFRQGASCLKSVQKVRSDIEYQGVVARFFSNAEYGPDGAGGKIN